MEGFMGDLFVFVVAAFGAAAGMWCICDEGF